MRIKDIFRVGHIFATVKGFGSHVEIPRELSKEKELHCFSIIFYPDEVTDWDDFISPFLFFTNKLVELLNVNSIEIFLDEGKRVFSICEYVDMYKNINTKGEYPPEKIIFRNASNIVAVMNTEFWNTCGGEAPYSDSYTLSFFLGRDIIEQLDSISVSIGQKYFSKKIDYIIKNGKPLKL